MSIEDAPESDRLRRVVFTNGVFDLFHHGHAEFLRKASAEGNYLLVGVTSDESNMEKRPSRDSWEIRSSNVLSSPYVDAVIETPWSRFLTPDFYQEYNISLHVQGDEQSDFAPARELGILKILGRTEEISTSMIVEILDSTSSTQLGGGDVNDVHSLHLNGTEYIIKRAKRQIAKNFSFRVPPLRVRDEYDALVAFRATLGQPKFIAEPVWTDSKNTLILRSVPFENQTLASAILRGNLVEQQLLDIISALGEMHYQTIDKPALRSRFGNTRGFREVKLGIQCLKASQDPKIVGEIQNLISLGGKAQHALLHGDFAPKNILVGKESFTFIDFEESGYWDPALEVGYFFAHLVISSALAKNVNVDQSRSIELKKLLTTYERSSRKLDSEFSSRVEKFMGVFILSRLDSPAPDKTIPISLKAGLRSTGERMLLNPMGLEDLGKLCMP